MGTHRCYRALTDLLFFSRSRLVAGSSVKSTQEAGQNVAYAGCPGEMCGIYIWSIWFIMAVVVWTLHLYLNMYGLCCYISFGVD